MRWTVDKVVAGRPVRLGAVNAPNQPAALKRAWEKWPDAIDPAQVQAGFSVALKPSNDGALGTLDSGKLDRRTISKRHA